jgi:hypothetical protein
VIFIFSEKLFFPSFTFTMYMPETIFLVFMFLIFSPGWIFQFALYIVCPFKLVMLKAYNALAFANKFIFTLLFVCKILHLKGVLKVVMASGAAFDFFSISQMPRP